MNNKIYKILSNKPELINEFPEWMLSENQISILRKREGLAIVEIAGRDSIAAAIKALGTGRVKAVLPTIAYTGTEFGNWDILFEKISFLKKLLNEKGVEVFEPIVVGSPKLWWMLCGRYTSQIIKKYGFYSPCLSCHLYLHTIRIPLAKKINCNIIVGGEKESHNGRIKINQIGVALDAYISFLKKYDIDLVLPLRFIKSGGEIQSIIGKTWDEGAEQMECVMSKNYLDENDRVEYSEEAIKKYFYEFAIPKVGKMIKPYISEERSGTS